MASVLYALARWVTRARIWVLVGWLVVLAGMGGLSVAFGQGTSDSFSIPGTESQQAQDSLAATFPQASGASAQLVVTTADGASITSAPYKSAIEHAVTAIEADPEVSAVTSPYGTGGLVSDDGQAAIVTIQMTKDQTLVSEAAQTALKHSAAELRTALPHGSSAILGGALFAVGVPGISATDAIGVLVAVVVLLVTFGSFLAAGMPLISAILGVGVSTLAIMFATAFTPVSSTTPFLAVMLGLAVGIDYALFLVSRHLDQRRQGMAVDESIARSVATAGSAVVFAGLTVIIALLGLSVANIPFLTTMGVGAAFAVAIAVLMSLTLVPALLSFAGERIGRPSRRAQRREARRAASAAASGAVDASAPAPAPHQPPRPNRFFLGWVRAATKWPVVTIVVIAAALGAAALPATHLRLDLSNAGALPADNPARQAYDAVSDHFGAGFNGPLIVTGSVVTSTDPVGLVNKVADELKRLPDVASVPLATPNATGDTAIIQVIPKSGPSDEATAQLVNRIRDLQDHFQKKYGVALSVTGFTAVGIDVSNRLGGALLPFGALVVGLSLILLTMVFRSLAVPIKATLGYLFSVVAALGAVSAVFVLGWGDKLLNVSSTGPVISFMPIILMGVLFGLAMDYEVFLVSRMREEYVHRGDARRAIETGFLGSSKVVTAAAIIMFAVFAAFIPEGDSTIKPIALGLAVGVFVDAFIVRMTLVPAVLALLGERAWSLPRWLDRALPRFDIEGEGLAREFRYADWPEPGAADAVAADGLVVAAPDGRVIAQFSGRIPRGASAVITADDPAAARALALALTARVNPDVGIVKVLGELVPERSGAARRRSAYLDVSDDGDLEARLRAVLRPRVELLAVDGLDHLTSPAGIARLRRALADQHEAARRAGHPLTVLVASTEPERALELVPGAELLDGRADFPHQTATTAEAFA